MSVYRIVGIVLILGGIVVDNIGYLYDIIVGRGVIELGAKSWAMIAVGIAGVIIGMILVLIGPATSEAKAGGEQAPAGGGAGA